MQKQSEQKMSENINKNNSNKLVSLLSLNDVIPEKLEEGISTKQAYTNTKNNSNKNMNSSNVLGFKEFLKLLKEKD